MASLAGVPVFQSHGHEDALLSFAAAEKLGQTLRTAGADVEWLPFTGGHEIPPTVVARLGAFLGRLASR
jgi:phospholipase/carboxylesterase